MVLKVDHVDIKVHDVDAEVAFLQLIGLEIKRRLPDHNNSVEMIVPGEESPVIEIHPCTDTEPGLRHVAFKSSDPKLVEKLKDAGYQFKNSNTLIASTGRTVSNVYDPSGLIWQITD